MRDIELNQYIKSKYNNLSESEKDLILENAKLQAIIETVEKYKLLIEFEGKEKASSKLLSNLLISILKEYDNTRQNLFREQVADYVLCNKSID